MTLPAGNGLWRIYFRRGNHPVSWNTFRRYGPIKSSRFDHQISPGQERTILYSAEDIGTCLAEVFQRDRMIDLIAKEPWLVQLGLTSELVLLDLTGLWPTKAGASMAINTGRRDRARRWSRAIYEAYPDIDGLYYPSSMFGNRPAMALYERAVVSISRSPLFHRPLADPVLRPFLRRITEDIGYSIG